MELDRGVLEALSLGSAEGSFSDKHFANLTDAALRVAADETSSEAVESALVSLGGDVLATKQLYSALLALSFEAARHDASVAELSSLLDDRLSADRLNDFFTRFSARKAAVRAQLIRSGATAAGLPTVTNVAWRVDYYVQNNQLEQIRVPVFFVELTLQEADGSDGKVEFTASLQELQDLLARVKDACNAAKIVAGAHQ